MHFDASRFLMHSACILLWCVWVISIGNRCKATQGTPRHFREVLLTFCWEAVSLKQFATHCNSLWCQKLGHSWSLNASQCLRGTTAPHLKLHSLGTVATASTAAGRCREMWRVLRGSNHHETLTDCTLSCHQEWNRIRSFVLGNPAANGQLSFSKQKEFPAPCVTLHSVYLR